MVFDDATLNRFWSKVDKSAGPDACWPWTASIKTTGYGHIRINGKMVTSHRVALLTKEEPPQPDLWALHSCDNRKCCNPLHLRWGTVVDNMRDRAARNQEWRKWNAKHAKEIGQKHLPAVIERNTKFKPSHIEYAAKLVKAGYSFTQIGEWYGVCRSTVAEKIKRYDAALTKASQGAQTQQAEEK